MCRDWIVNGKRCETGADLVLALGRDAARRVNTHYSSGELWAIRDGIRVAIEVTDDEIAETCLCGVSKEALEGETGERYEYDAEEDAFRPVHPVKEPHDEHD